MDRPASSHTWISCRDARGQAPVQEELGPDIGRAFSVRGFGLHGGELVVCDKGYAGRDLQAIAREHWGATILRPARKDEPSRGPELSWIRQRIESIFWTLKDRLGLERHRARTLCGLRARIAAKLLALAAGIWVNRYPGQPTRSFAA